MKTLLAALKQAAIAGMLVVRKGQLMSDTDSQTKKDGSFLTPTDVVSQDIIIAELRHHLDGSKDIEIVGEEKAGAIKSLEANRDGRIKIFIDALDGTGAFQIGIPSSTVIVAAYDSLERCVIACVVCDPACGRIWSADAVQPTLLEWYDYQNGVFGRPEERHVWTAKGFSKETVVLMDVSHGFRISTDTELQQLFKNLVPRVKIQMPGSNGLIQALVANGRKGIVGSITTAISGPWDLCGAYLVLRAGGYARAFDFRRRNVAEVNPLDVTGYHTVVTGNTKETVDILSDARLDAFCRTQAHMPRIT